MRKLAPPVRRPAHLEPLYTPEEAEVVRENREAAAQSMRETAEHKERERLEKREATAKARGFKSGDDMGDKFRKVARGVTNKYRPGRR